ncbi:LysR family transcriptional regulator [Vibrio sp. V12_P9A6T4]|uniref:LysR family transcriptional regulator n=1 Tax=Vibrio sp. V12_P9A6T4 TaxID=1938667 RepID=UPI000B8E6E66|nr:LysR family transcriptional regulator [Vibrio sp. V12_P9A6T4]OXX54309.1 LysR family transcriptional regulator [Vibrio sp. V12_P9A6T4]
MEEPPLFMDYIHLSRISLKHLTALHVMLSTRSVTQTAAQLCISPSSISKNLSQLRILLEDELFYRDGTHLIPTPFALQMGPTVHSILSSMNGLLHHSNFEPQHYQGKYRLAMRESAFELFAPILTNVIKNHAPQASFTIYSKDHYGFDALQSGLIDFVILPHDISQPPTRDKELVWEVITHDEMVCLMRSDHALANEVLTTEHYLAQSHIGIMDKELAEPFFEQNLAQSHRARHVPVVVADFGAAAILCKHTDSLFTCSKRWAEQAMQAKGLLIKPLPFNYGKVAYSLVWNKPSMNDQALKWLCDQLKKPH